MTNPFPPGREMVIKSNKKEVIKAKSCIKPMVDDQYSYMIDLYGYYESGHLYKEGGISQQPPFYLRIMKIIEGHLNGE